MTKLSRDDVLKLARLARLELSEEEISAYQDQLSQILTYVDMLKAEDVNGLPPTDQVTGLRNVTRADRIVDYGYDPRKLLNNVPKVRDNQIETKRMIG